MRELVKASVKGLAKGLVKALAKALIKAGSWKYEEWQMSYLIKAYPRNSLVRLQA